MNVTGFVPTAKPEAPRTTKPVMAPAVFGTIVFVITELMFFMALLSAYHVVKSRAFVDWSAPNDVRLPVLVTSINTLILMASGILLLNAEKSYRHRETQAKAASAYLQALVLGAVFVGVQGYEWMKLIQLGFTISAGLFSATFFLLIGSHAFHAVGALLVMAALWPSVKSGRITLDRLRAMTIFWFFIVGVWPILFGTVYF